MFNSLKILFLSNRGLLPIKDGHTRRSYNILKGLAEKNQVYYLSLYETPEEIDPKNVKKLEEICNKVEFLSAPSKEFSVPMVARLIRSLFSLDAYTIWRHYSHPFLERADTLISSGEFDIVHCDILPLAYIVNKKRHIYQSITDHDVSYLKCLRMGKESRNPFLKMFLYLEAWKLRRLEGKIFTKVDLGITVSELDRRILQELCPEGEFAVVENGVETNIFIPSNNIENNKLLWLGGFDHYPNRDGIYYFLEKIYPKIKQGMPNINFDIIGGGITERLKNLTEGDSSVRLMGYVDDPLPYMQSTSVFVVPILSGGGTRLKVLEAMSVGKAIVSTTVGCEGLNGINGTHYILADDPDTFAKEVIRLFQDSLYRKNLGLNARKFVEEYYDYAMICNKLNEIYSRSISMR
jgi:polysaccharide biosynthesis protein PslH